MTSTQNDMQHAEAKVEDNHCGICLQGTEESGEQVRSGMCACRGETAGFYHRSCLVKYAQEETKRGISTYGKVNLEKIW